MAGAVGQQRVPKSFLEEYLLRLPSIAEQEEIVRILDEMFAREVKIKDMSETVIGEINVVKKSVLARAFRGMLDTNDPTEKNAMKLLAEKEYA